MSGYLLVCGQGRLSSFKLDGEQRIPALVVTVTDDEAFMMSLAESIARRRTKPLERLAGVTLLRKKGYSNKEIAEKTGLTLQYLQDILLLLDKGEASHRQHSRMTCLSSALLRRSSS
ncbi:hypothetical protein [Polaromonas sp.]|uniref:ParB/RepB/Spo0J family partition protein n=1 Tax=Polaromonas sp. TaxID=1869339 RepID=UPI003264C9C4